MVFGLNKAVRPASCANCRFSLLRSFTAITGIPFHPHPYQGISRSTYNARYISKTAHPTVSESHLKSLHDNGAFLSSNENEDKSLSIVDSLPNSDSASLPWYLQHDKTLVSQRPLSERQKLPDLPESSPPILQALLQQISVTLGLDDLTLLDLRGLDPPPALGANLLMIIGTARSEKHLHVSAGNLCRWLRSEYMLRPEADGLLGRNELKLKMRRKNRRAKLLGSGNADDDYDDGVRTGWVCVNIGTVDHPLAERTEIEGESFIGFGRQTEGTKVVVQMLVEDKRKELDLEKLWSGIKKRQLLGNPEGDEGTGDLAMEEIQPEVSTNNGSSLTSDQVTVRKSGPMAHFIPIRSSSRSFHTSARSKSTSLATGFSALEEPAHLDSSSNSTESVRYQILQKEIFSALHSNNNDAIRALYSDFQGSPILFRSCLVGCLKQHLSSMTSERALEALGNGPTDFSSTPMLSSLNMATSEFPSTEEWEFRVWLYCFARKIGHDGYGLTGLQMLFEQLQLCGIAISRDIYLRIIRSALDHPVRDDQQQLASHVTPSHKARTVVADVLRDMHLRNLPILSADVFAALHESSANLSLRLNTLMQDLDIRVTEENDLIQLLDVCAKNRRWPVFWKLWDSPPSNGHSRSSALYALMFRRVADTESQKYCIKALRDWIPGMNQEEPEVEIEGEVLEGVKACLAVADPFFQESSLTNANAKGEWLELWRKCYQG